MRPERDTLASARTSRMAGGMPKIQFAGQSIECPLGANLRVVLLRARLPLYTRVARAIHCRGHGTCGTCHNSPNVGGHSVYRLFDIGTADEPACAADLPMLTLAEVSERAGMSESQFSRNIRRATGNTFTDFVNRLRVARACQLLMETDAYIANVCYESGFNNVANFNRRFLQLKGMTPKEFRRQIDARFGAGH